MRLCLSIAAVLCSLASSALAESVNPDHLIDGEAFGGRDFTVENSRMGKLYISDHLNANIRFQNAQSRSKRSFTTTAPTAAYFDNVYRQGNPANRRLAPSFGSRSPRLKPTNAVSSTAANPKTAGEIRITSRYDDVTSLRRQTTYVRSNVTAGRGAAPRYSRRQAQAPIRNRKIDRVFSYNEIAEAFFNWSRSAYSIDGRISPSFFIDGEEDGSGFIAPTTRSRGLLPIAPPTPPRSTTPVFNPDASPSPTTPKTSPRVIPPASPKPLPSTPASSRKFQFQYGPGFLQYWSPERHLINELKMQGYSAASAIVDGVVLSFEDLVQRGHFDAPTQTWVSLPKNAAGDDVPIRVGIFRGDAGQNPELYATDYAITWEGDGVVDFSFGQKGTYHLVQSNRIETSYTVADAGWSGLQITSIGVDGVRNIQAYRLGEEQKLLAGQVWSTHWLDFISGYDVVRFMDIALTNNSIVRKASQIATEDNLYWNGSTDKLLPFDRARSFPIELMLRACVQADCVAWINMPAMMGAPDVFDTPAYVDEIKVNGAPYLRDRAAAHTDEIIASDEIRNWADRVVASLVTENYPEDKPIYLEVGNEIWNFGGPFARATHYMWGVAIGLGLDGNTAGLPGTETRGGYGYLSAKLAHEFENALAAVGRDQEFKIVIGAHTAHTARTTWALEGAQQYFSKNGLSVSDWMPKLSLATTSYFSGGFTYRAPQSGFMQDMYGLGDETAWLAKWRSDLASGVTALSNLIKSHLINGPVESNGTKEWIVERTQVQKSIAADFGVGYLGQYEGGSHDTLHPKLAADPQALQFYVDFRQSQNAADIQKEVYDALIEESPGAIISDFAGFCPNPNDPRSPWCEQAWGKSTPLTDVLDSYRRKAVN